MNQNSRILIVDDNAVNVDLLVATLSDDYHLATAQSVARLHKLFTKVCTLHAMRAGHWTFEHVPSHLGNLVRATANAVAPDAARRNVQLDLTLCEDATTQLDPGCIQNVMIALLENAIRFSLASGRVRVQLWQEGAHLCVTVADQGPGIAPERLPYIFSPMPQDDISHHTEGQGLSLAIAHQVVEAHNGTIRVDSTPGATTFMMRCPECLSKDRERRTPVPNPRVQACLPAANQPTPRHAGMVQYPEGWRAVP